MYSIGIDLGTTNTVVAVYKKGVAETLRIDGNYFLPSVVSFIKNQEPYVGQSAKSRLEVNPESTIGSSKRYIGDDSKNYLVLGRSYSPIDIAAQVLRYAVQGAKKALGQEIYDAVITVPAYFNDAQRAATKLAGEQAGLNVLKLLPEPSAAAVCYGFQKKKDQTLLVYDFGGGTFDVSILKVEANDFKVIGVGGDVQLGGDDIDHALVKWMAEEFQKQHGMDLLDESKKDFAYARQRLKEEAEKAKKELTEADFVEIIVPQLAGKTFELELSIDKFNALAKPTLMKTIKCVKDILRETGLTVDDIDRVVLVGGSTKIRAVRELVTDEIKEPFKDLSPDEAVAWGAAIIAASLDAPESRPDEQTPKVKLKDVTAHSLGIGMWDSDNRYLFQTLISKNSTYPCEGGVLGFTADPYQEVVEVRVFRGEELEATNNDELGDLLVPVDRPVKEQVPVAAVFRLDRDGILHFQAVAIPLRAIQNEKVKLFLTNAINKNGRIDVALLEDLVKRNIVAKPEAISIKSS